MNERLRSGQNSASGIFAEEGSRSKRYFVDPVFLSQTTDEGLQVLAILGGIATMIVGGGIASYLVQRGEAAKIRAGKESQEGTDPVESRADGTVLGSQ